MDEDELAYVQETLDVYDNSALRIVTRADDGLSDTAVAAIMGWDAS